MQRNELRIEISLKTINGYKEVYASGMQIDK